MEQEQSIIVVLDSACKSINLFGACRVVGRILECLIVEAACAQVARTRSSPMVLDLVTAKYSPPRIVLQYLSSFLRSLIGVGAEHECGRLRLVWQFQGAPTLSAWSIGT